MNTTNETHSNEIRTRDKSQATEAVNVPAKLDELSQKLVREFMTEISDLNVGAIRRAVNEAVALASTTEIPLLALPLLAEEKIQDARNWARRQNGILRRSYRGFADLLSTARWAMRPAPVAAALILLVALTGCGRGAEQKAPPPPAVTVASVEQRELVEWSEFTGRTEGVDSVEVRPRVSGYIQSVQFQSGQLVKKGDVLFVIDPRWHQAEFDRRQAEAERAKVQLDNARREADRSAQLLANKAISTEEGDARVTRFQDAKAALLAAEASRDSAKLDLEYTQVRAPIDGRVSRAILTEGNYVNGVAGGASLLTTIVSVNPVYVYADIDEDTLLKFNALAHDGKLETNSGGKVPVQLELADEKDFPHQGYIESFDNHLDANTGSILLRAVFTNDDGRIVPGLFARIRVPTSERHPALLVAEKAIGTDQAQKFVLTVTPTNTVAYQAVKLGPQIGGKRIVRAGLQGGERIVVNGLQRVNPGAAVTPQELAADDPGWQTAKR